MRKKKKMSKKDTKTKEDKELSLEQQKIVAVASEIETILKKNNMGLQFSLRITEAGIVPTGRLVIMDKDGEANKKD